MTYGYFKDHLKRCIIRKYSGNGWALLVDIDEHFDFPLRNGRDIGCLLRYLSRTGYNSVISYMLDLFPASESGFYTENFTVEHKFYELTNVQVKLPTYKGWKNTPVRCEIPQKSGGIRLRAYGMDPFLTKVPLFRPSIVFNVKNSHSLTFSQFQAQYADFTGVLLHYKFTENYTEKFLEIAKNGQYWNNSLEYKIFEKLYLQYRVNALYSEDSLELLSIDALIDQGFLIVSQSFREGLKNLP